MKSVGKVFQEARRQKRYSLAELEGKTKIKKEFIQAIEKENWTRLPDYSVVAGFAKNLASFLDLQEQRALALLRRDYPPTKINPNPKPDLEKRFTWTPRWTFFLGVGTVLVLILGYLAIQYRQFVRPPKLVVETPEENQTVVNLIIPIEGQTDPNATLTANNQPVLIGENGDFKTEIEISSETKKIIFKAISRSGKETTLERKIKPEL